MADAIRPWRKVGYARRRGVLGDVRRLTPTHVSGITHAGRPFSWKLNADVTLIEFGSLNPENDNYEEGGRVVRY